VAKTRRTETRCRPQHVGSELDDFEDELKEDADEHEDEIDPDVDEDENEPAPSPAHRPDSLPPLLTNYLLPPLSLDEMRTKIEDDYYAVLTRLIEARDQHNRSRGFGLPSNPIFHTRVTLLAHVLTLSDTCSLEKRLS